MLISMLKPRSSDLTMTIFKGWYISKDNILQMYNCIVRGIVTIYKVASHILLFFLCILLGMKMI